MTNIGRSFVGKIHTFALMQGVAKYMKISCGFLGVVCRFNVALPLIMICSAINCTGDSRIRRRVIHKQVTVYHFIYRDKNNTSSYEKMLLDAGLVDISGIDTSIRVLMKYASCDNFVGVDMYHGFSKCYLRFEAAQKLKKAQHLLKQRNHRYGLVVFDAARPCAVQRIMWDSANLTDDQRRNFLSDPDAYSLHNFGMAVDCGIIDEKGNLIDMGTPYDFPGELAYPILEASLVKKGTLRPACVENRNVLRWSMKSAGFIPNEYEWWHFSACTRAFASKNYPRIVDFTGFMNPETHQFASVTKDERISYRVQVASSRVGYEKAKSALIGWSISEYAHNGVQKYTTGEYDNYISAYNLKDSVRKCGIFDAFVVCFKDGKRISVND